MFVNTIWALLTHPDYYAAVQCLLGAALALLEGEVGLRTLFACLPALRLSPAHQAAPYGHEFRSVPTLVVAW